MKRAAAGGGEVRERVNKTFILIMFIEINKTRDSRLIPFPDVYASSKNETAGKKRGWSGRTGVGRRRKKFLHD